MLEFLKDASKAYYEGCPIISDEVFDHLAELYKYDGVGYTPLENTIKHYKRMYSLEKVYNPGDAPFPESAKTITTPKLDGAAIALYYLEGKLVQATTRGNGIVGQNISHLIPALPVPKTIDRKGLIQVTGEIVAPSTIPRARNYASGALGLKDISDFATRDIYFYAYNVYPYLSDSYVSDLVALSKNGISTVLDIGIADRFPTDGKVVRLKSHREYEQQGFTSNHPKGAYAVKTRKTGEITTLLDVTWQVGRTGVVTPVAILEPVIIDDVRVTRATLHNMEFIKQKDLTLGCKVEVIRSGEIIPEIIGVYKK